MTDQGAIAVPSQFPNAELTAFERRQAREGWERGAWKFDGEQWWTADIEPGNVDLLGEWRPVAESEVPPTVAALWGRHEVSDLRSRDGSGDLLRRFGTDAAPRTAPWR